MCMIGSDSQHFMSTVLWTLVYIMIYVCTGVRLHGISRHVVEYKTWSGQEFINIWDVKKVKIMSKTMGEIIFSLTDH